MSKVDRVHLQNISKRECLIIMKSKHKVIIRYDFLVEPWRLELQTSSLQRKRSPS